MKTLIITAVALIISTVSSSSWAYVQVRGYIRSNGTIVSPYIRSNPDSNPYNNLSSFNLKSSPVNETPYNPGTTVAMNAV